MYYIQEQAKCNFMMPLAQTWNMELGTWNMERGTLNLLGFR